VLRSSSWGHSKFLPSILPFSFRLTSHEALKHSHSPEAHYHLQSRYYIHAKIDKEITKHTKKGGKLMEEYARIFIGGVSE